MPDKNSYELDLQFFEKYAASAPSEAFSAWLDWRAQRRRAMSDEAQYRKVLEICSGLSEGSVRNYRTGRPNTLGSERLAQLDWITEGLGKSVSPRHERAIGARRSNRPARIALFTRLDVPGASYRLSVIRGMCREAAARHLELAIHETSASDLSGIIERTLLAFKFDGIMMLRISPTPRDLKPVEKSQTPVVLIHADRYDYPAPVLENIVPDQTDITAQLKAWVDRNPSWSRDLKREPEVVMVAMDDENPGSPFDTKDECPSIRNARKQAIRRAFEDLGVKVKDRPVEDYSFHHARRVFEEWNNADLFICLSDELAVAMKLQLLAAGREWKGHVVGFDDSELAKAEYIPSFCQGLDSLGAQAVKTLHDFLLSEHINEWPPFEEKLTKVHLEERYGER